jgi:hypothetical protein
MGGRGLAGMVGEGRGILATKGTEGTKRGLAGVGQWAVGSGLVVFFVPAGGFY